MTHYDQHKLPRAVLTAEDAPSTRHMIRKAQEAINTLEEQMTVFELVQFFDKNPELMTMSYDLNSESDDEGGSYRYASASVNSDTGEYDGDDEDEDEDELENLRENVQDFLNNQSDDWLDSLEGRVIRRPAEGVDLTESLMSQCLSPQDFASWQASVLDAAAKTATISRPKAGI